MKHHLELSNLKAAFLKLYRYVPASARKYTTPAITKLISSSDILGRIPVASKFMYVKRAEYLFKGGRFDEAFSLLDGKIHHKRNDIRLLNLFAEVAIKVDKLDQCRTASLAIMRINPIHVRSAKRLKAISAKYTFDRDAVYKFLDEEVDYRRFADAAEFCLNLGELEDCITISNRGISIIDRLKQSTPDSEEQRSRMCLQKGHALLLTHRRDEAEQALRDVQWGTRSYGRAAMLRARIMMENDDPDSAIFLIEDQHKRTGKSIGYHNTYLPAMLRKNRIGQAFLTYRLRRESSLVAKLFHMPTAPQLIELKSPRNKTQKALFLSEGGPGDEIRFSSIYRCLQHYFAQISVTCDPRLNSIMARNFPDISFISAARYRKDLPGRGPNDRSSIKDPSLRNFVSNDVVIEGKDKDVVCTILDTLGELRADRNDFRRQRTRFAVDADLDAHWKRQLKGRANLQVGLAWRSLLSSPDRDRHYLKVEDLSHLSMVEGVDFWILQAGVTDEELRYLSERLNIIVPDVDLKDDFEGQAALLANLDVTISPLTTVAELAGMVDCRTLIFCRTPEAIWRRNDDGTDVWYDNARLVAGEPIHDTEALMKCLVKELQGIQQSPCPTNS